MHPDWQVVADAPERARSGVTDARLHPAAATAYAVGMEVRVGPVSAASAVAWVRYARGVLDTPGDGEVPSVDPATVDAFRDYLNLWERHAAAGDPFVWEGEVNPERLEYLAHSFARIVEHLATVAGTVGAIGAPPEGDEFYQALVLAIINTLDLYGSDATQGFSEQLRDRWPGLRRV